MTKRYKRQKKVQHPDIMRTIHQSLRADFACTEEQVELIDHALKGEAPAHVIEHMKQVHEGKVQLSPHRPFVIEMEDGSTTGPYELTIHPILLLEEYLTGYYEEHFGCLYWGALTPANSPKDFYQFL